MVGSSPIGVMRRSFPLLDRLYCIIGTMETTNSRFGNGGIRVVVVEGDTLLF